MKKSVAIAVVALGLLGAAPAQAKELLGVQLCGPSGCETQRSGGLLEGQGGPFGGGPLVAPAKPGAWYRGYLLAGDRGKVMGKMLFYYVPDARQVVQPGRFGQTTSWMRAGGGLGALIDGLSTRVRPFATPHVTSVTLNGKPVDDPESYLRLWTVGSKAKTYPNGSDSQQVMFFTEPASPWSDGNYVVAYAKSNLLLRDGQLVSMPRDLAAQVATGASLDIRRPLPWIWIGIAAAASIAIALGLARSVVRRLRPRTAPRPLQA